jgi:hypothetical protein
LRTRNNRESDAHCRGHIDNLICWNVVICSARAVGILAIKDLQVLYSIEKLIAVSEQSWLTFGARSDGVCDLLDPENAGISAVDLGQAMCVRSRATRVIDVTVTRLGYSSGIVYKRSSAVRIRIEI